MVVVLQEQDVPRVRIAVKEAVDEDLLQHGIRDETGHRFFVDALIGRMQDVDAVDIFHDEDCPGRVVRERPSGS